MSPETEKAPTCANTVGTKDGETLLNSSSLDPTLVTPSESSGTEKNSRPVADYTKQQLQDCTPEEFASKHCTDDANGVRFAQNFGDKAKHSTSHGWLVYDGKRWKRDQKAVRILAQKLPEIVRGEVQRLSSSMDLRDSDTLKRFGTFTTALGKHAKYTGSSKGIDATLREAAVKDEVSADGIEFDSDIYLLNCLNGTVDLRTGELRNHRREDQITKLSPVEYVSGSPCPRWIQFLDEVFGSDGALIDYVQWLIGYSLSGSVEYQIFPILHGRGQNGKGVFIRTIANILGQDYSQEMNPEEIMVQKNARHETGLAALHGVRFVSISETEDGRRINEALVKKLTGGDKIRARFMRQDGFEFQPQFKMWLATNYRPAIKDDSFGMWRRIRLIPFDRTFEEHEKDTRLEEKLRQEMPGILVWAVQGVCQAGREPTLPDCVRAANQDYEAESDALQEFLSECTSRINSKTPKAELYDVYRQYTDEGCEDFRMFNKRIKDRGIKEVRIGGARCWEGIAIKSEWKSSATAQAS